MLRLSVIRERSDNSTINADEACRLRLTADSKFAEGRDASSSQQQQQQQDQDNHLHGISSKTEWFDSARHAWTVESVPKHTRYDDVGTSHFNTSSRVNNNAAVASASATPFRTNASAATSNSTTTNNNIINNNQQAKKYVALCLGSSFTREMCEHPATSLPVQVLKRMRASGSHTMSVLCNVAAIISQPLQSQVTMKDVTEQLLPEEIVAEAALFAASGNGNVGGGGSGKSENHAKSGDDEEGIPQILEACGNGASTTGCRLLGLPSDQFRFIRCGADSYGGIHHNQSAAKNILRLSNMNQKQADAALVESLIESLAESESFFNAMGRTSIVFSFFDEHTHAASQIWFVADAQLALFGNDHVAVDLMFPGLWRNMAGAASIVRSLVQETVIFAYSGLIAAADQFDRILSVTVAAASTTTRTASDSEYDERQALNSFDAVGVGADVGYSALLMDPQHRRTQLLQIRQQQERLLDEMQKQMSQKGTSTDKLAAERQYQRLLVGEIDLLERRIEEVRTLTDQERLITQELEAKQDTAAQRVKELEEQKKRLVEESRTLNDENRSNAAVAEALHHQIQMLEQRLAAASSTIVAHRQHQSDLRMKKTGYRSSSSSSNQQQQQHQHQQLEHDSSDLSWQLQAKHENAVAEAQKHFIQIQQKIADDARDSEDQFNADMRTVQSELSNLQQQTEHDGARLGEMRANWKANENLRDSLEKEYQALRDAMQQLMQNAPELASPQPGSILDERRDKLQRSVSEYKQQLAELRVKREQAQSRRETAEENVLSSERHLQRSLATIQLRIPPQLESQREHLCDEEQCARRRTELEFEATSYELQNRFHLALYDRVRATNTRRHQKRHEELKLEVHVAEETLHETDEKLRQAQASSDVFAQRIEQCAREQEKLREEHRKTLVELQQQLITAESEPVEEAIRREMKSLQQKINTATAEIELIHGAMMKAPSSHHVSKSSSSNFPAAAPSSIVAAAALAGSSSTYAMHRSLRAAAPDAGEIRHRLQLLRRDSYKRLRVENAKAAELEQRLDARRNELAEKASLISTLRTTINELHEQLQLRAGQLEERKSELEQLRRSEESVIHDLDEELQYAKEISNRHKNENRLQLTRVAQVMQEQEHELARSRHEIAKLERKRNEILRKMSESNEATLLMELEHEHQKRDELRTELERAGIAASPDMTMMSSRRRGEAGSPSFPPDYEYSSMRSHHEDVDDDEFPEENYFSANLGSGTSVR